MAIKYRKYAVWLAVFHSFLTLIYKDVFFDSNTRFVLFCRIMATFVLVGFYLLVFWCYSNRHEEFVRKFLMWGCIYFLILLALFLCVYPGSWRGGDEFVILSKIKNGIVDFWHHYITYIFWGISLVLIPLPAAIPFAQMLISCMITAYIMAMIQTQLGSRKPNLVMLIYFLPFITLPVLDSIFYPMRMTLYAFLELLLIFKLYIFVREGGDYNKKAVLAISLLTAIVSVWRTEGFFWVLIVGIIFSFSTSLGDIKRKMIWIMFTAILTVGIYAPQSVGIAKSKAKEYKFTGMIEQIVPLIEEEMSENTDSHLLRTIDRVLSVDVINAGIDKNWDGTKIYWSHKELGNGTLIRDNYTNIDYKNFWEAYLKLVVKHMRGFIKERCDIFLKSMPGTTLSGIFNIYESDQSRHLSFANDYVANKPINTSLRMEVLRFMAAERLSSDFRFLIWCVIPQIIGAFLATIWNIKKRRWLFALLSCSLWWRAGIVFLTAPASYFMYYFSIYLIGLFWGFFGLGNKINDLLIRKRL